MKTITTNYLKFSQIVLILIGVIFFYSDLRAQEKPFPAPLITQEELEGEFYSLEEYELTGFKEVFGTWKPVLKKKVFPAKELSPVIINGDTVYWIEKREIKIKTPVDERQIFRKNPKKEGEGQSKYGKRIYEEIGRDFEFIYYREINFPDIENLEDYTERYIKKPRGEEKPDMYSNPRGQGGKDSNKSAIDELRVPDYPPYWEGITKWKKYYDAGVKALGTVVLHGPSYKPTKDDYKPKPEREAEPYSIAGVERKDIITRSKNLLLIPEHVDPVISIPLVTVGAGA